jgi:hypothetical protein
MRDVLRSWVEELSKVRVLDPACGSGNFLYLALRRMLDLWHEVRVFLAQLGLPSFLEKQVHPSQLYGLATNVARIGFRCGLDWLSAMIKTEWHRMAH